ncbi:hypothetical protein NK553_24925 [Pseudomonas sp. ZM23]|uniref:Uncharacterized protein n=1 Tax=Pseudomonas triclosanedens TaxID=2961893 RepID=A0ABY6ZSF3_9PSED|nr:hypothetical protein [Pseudomonas triclosanedens]MCP8467204.1 hypothetical protein [Pseudomonas triclosanedens]MCP8472531.1 hypothetical protein [Pseudomonas triclosanedens]WAI47768.1 hypothetical protein OU419_18545 [Pseudomonas triclosanedens]
MFSRTVKFEFLDIISDGIVIDPTMADGRPLPSVIIDARRRPDITEYLIAHQGRPAGDVSTQWGTTRFGWDIGLIIKTLRPMEIEFVLGLHAIKNAALIEGIIRNSGLYIQSGVPGDRVSEKYHDPRVLIEVVPSSFREKWNDILLKGTIKSLRENGFSKKQSEKISVERISLMREFWDKRREK